MIVQEEGYLGPHSPILKDGDTQSLVYLPTDSTGSWYLSPEQQQLQRHDRPATGKSRCWVERSKKLLMECLKAAGVTFQQQRGYTQKELQVFARNYGIKLYENKEVIMNGWEGQPKGLLQGLWVDWEVHSRWAQGYQQQGQLTVFPGSYHVELPRLQGGGDYTPTFWAAAWSNGTTDAKAPCWACWRRSWVQLGTCKSFL